MAKTAGQAHALIGCYGQHLRPTLQEYRGRVDQYMGIRQQALCEFEDIEIFPLVQIDTTQAKRLIAQRVQDLATVLLQQVEQRLRTAASASL